jgi:hypothetical protein
MNTLASVILSALQDTRDGGYTVEERAEAIAAAVRAETPESGALGQWIASLRVGDTLTVDDIHRFVRVELALRNADKHHQQARAMTAERDEWRDAAKWAEDQHQHWKTVAEAATAQRDEARRLHMVVRNELDTLRARLAARERDLNYIRRVTVGAVESDKLAATCKTIGEYRYVLLKSINAMDIAVAAEMQGEKDV